MPKSNDFFDTKRETIPLPGLKALQLRALRRSVRFAGERSEFYRNKKNLSAKDARFSSLQAFVETIPFTTKADLLECGTYENLCVPESEITEAHCSSGTSNRPVFSFLTEKDIRESAAYLARTWYMQGVRRESVFGMFASYGLFSAGLINHYALQRIGAFVIPLGNASAPKAPETLKEFGADSCAAVASYYPYLIAMADEAGFDLKRLGITHMIAGGEPFSEGQRRFIEERFGARLYDQYGLCEINTGLAGECSEQNGLHLLADYSYPEIIDPESGMPLADGEEGELVLTTLRKEASPLLRYRTGDITSITHAPCTCGRTMPRIARIRRRVTDTLFYKGVKLEKPYVIELLEELSAYCNPYLWQMEINSMVGRDELVLKVKPTKRGEKKMDHVAAHVHKKMGLKVKMGAFTPEESARLGNGKHKHFIENRSK